MYNINKKQKIILGIITAIVAGFVCYYVSAREENNETPLAFENNLEIQKEEVEEPEEYSDDRILVHVSGAVNKEGVVELKIDSRISDAIEKARRSKRRRLRRRYKPSLQIRGRNENTYSN